jgi:hypothetical protein
MRNLPNRAIRTGRGGRCRIKLGKPGEALHREAVNSGEVSRRLRQDRCRRRVAPLDAPCRCAKSGAVPSRVSAAMPARGARPPPRAAQCRRRAVPLDVPAAAAGPLPVVRSAARPSTPARWRVAPGSSPASPARRSTASLLIPATCRAPRHAALPRRDRCRWCDRPPARGIVSATGGLGSGIKHYRSQSGMIGSPSP